MYTYGSGQPCTCGHAGGATHTCMQVLECECEVCVCVLHLDVGLSIKLGTPS